MFGWILPWKFLLPDRRATEKILLSSIVSAISGCNGPELPLQVVHAMPTTLKPSWSKYDCKPLFFNISAVTWLPGAKEVFTFLFFFRPKFTRFLATRAAAITLLGFAVFVQLVIAAIKISASFISNPKFGTLKLSSLKSLL